MSLKITFFFIFAIGGFLAADAIVNGEFAQWNRNAAVVKVMGREGPGSLVLNCLGTLVTSSLVLTSPQCVKNDSTNAQLQEFFVIVSQLPKDATSDKPSRILDGAQAYEAKIFEMTPRWALLAISAINATALCPPDPAPKRVARLPLNPSMDGEALMPVEPSALVSSNCYILGFKAGEGKDFAANKEFVSISLERLAAPDSDANPDSSFYIARIAGNSTACFDDMGAPLICHLSAHAEDFQVGMFRALNFYQDNHPKQTSDGYCAAAIEMQFSGLIGDRELKNAIFRHSRLELIAVYEKCGFME